ncbi:hypothetical protein [Cohnella hongkongensis]|uniref:DUF4179 domain-containing protein n=1 Tax=Cohnella hongkongensis TaxID=178337 RepID=A0ABV9FH12_9BACL
MEKLTNGDSRVELLKELPPRPLSSAAEQAIAQKLRQTEAAQARQSGRRRTRRRYALLAATAAAALAAVVIAAVPGLAERMTAGRWGSELFGARPAAPAAELSPLFDLLDRDGTLVYPDRLRGIEGRIAFSEYPGGFVARSELTGSKVFWYVWGDPQQLAGANLVATAVSLDNGTKFVLNEAKLSGPFYGADAHVVTRFNEFPSRGTWRIDVRLNDELYGSIVVRVKDEYIQTESARFLVSKDDAVAGGIETSVIVDGHGLADTIDVIVQRADAPGQARKLTFFKEQEYVQAKGLIPVTSYTGRLEFDAPGRWRIEALGEKTEIEVRP